MLDQQTLKRLLDYGPDTGVFRWREGRGSARAGTVAGRLNSHGYQRIKIFGREYAAHRLAWLWAFGAWPDDQIDHINGVRDDNRLANLRGATRTENNGNSRRREDNTSGFKGVSWCKQDKKWRAGIKINNVNKHLGFFDTPEEAHEAYRLAAEKYFGEFARFE